MIVTASMLLIGRSHRVEAQEQAPDLRMLLNLDLFGTQAPGSPENGSTGPDGSRTGLSMLDQIRALSAMGYLGGEPGGQPADAFAPDGGDSAPQSPANDGEVPQL